MEQNRNLPHGFKTWVQVYDHVRSCVPSKPTNNTLITFESNEKLGEREVEHITRISFGAIKEEALEELDGARITKSEFLSMSVVDMKGEIGEILDKIEPTLKN